MVERFNRTLLSLQTIAAEESEEDWDLKIPTIMLAYHSSIHESTGETPFSLMFGREAQLPVDIIYNLPKGSESPEPDHKYANLLRKQLKEAYARIRSHLEKWQDDQKSYYDIQVHGKAYKKGDQV